MNAINLLGYIGYGVAVISGLSAYVNRDRYKTLIEDIYKPGNQELREQLATAREECTSIKSENAALKATAKEKDRYIKHLEELNLRLPDFAELLKQGTSLASQVSTNHKEIMLKLTGALGGTVDNNTNAE
jgi:hypothetical protein